MRKAEKAQVARRGFPGSSLASSFFALSYARQHFIVVHSSSVFARVSSGVVWTAA